MIRSILAIDVGTSALKLAVFTPSLAQRCAATRSYPINVYADGGADIDPELWWQALRACCNEVKGELSDVGVVSLAVTTPGLTPMTADGRPLGRAILYLDGRSHAQAAAIRDKVGDDVFLRDTCNLPVSGGSSLCSILWYRDNEPAVWADAAMWGHCNTYVVKRMTGRWAIDPSTTSITGLYNTSSGDMSWNAQVLAAAGMHPERLPPLMQSYDVVGSVLPAIAEELNLPRDCVVLCGGNDVVLASLSSGLTEPGQVSISYGTSLISSVCTARPLASANFNVRSHALPGRWLTFYVLNAGGKALEWFHSVFCQDLTTQEFYGTYVPGVLSGFLDSVSESVENELPTFEPYLAGSRYAMSRQKGSFAGLTLATTRDELLLSMVRSSAEHHAEHIREVGTIVELAKTISVSGGAARIPGMLDAWRHWIGDFDFVFHDESSVIGAAILGRMYLTGEQPRGGYQWGTASVDDVASSAAAAVQGTDSGGCVVEETAHPH